MSSDIWLNVSRLNTLYELSLINAPEETIYNTITQFASKAIGTPVALVSMVADNYQFFKSQVGLPDPYRSKRGTPFSHSFCKHVVAENQPLIVSDARTHDKVKNNKAIRDLNVIGYLGIPLTLKDGKSLGSLCVIDSDVREWTDTEIAIMTELATIVTKEFDTRAMVASKRTSKADLEDLQNRIIEFIDSIDVTYSKLGILKIIREQKKLFDLL